MILLLSVSSVSFARSFGLVAFRGDRPLEGDEEGVRDEGCEEAGRDEGRASERASERDERGLLEEGRADEGRVEVREPERLRDGDEERVLPGSEDEAAAVGRGGDREWDEGRGSTMRTTRRRPLGGAMAREGAKGARRARRLGEGSCRIRINDVKKGVNR